MVRDSSKSVVERWSAQVRATVAQGDRATDAWAVMAGAAPPARFQAGRTAPGRPAQARASPTLRANPYPKVTDPFCRLPLPTLFYQLEAVHLGDLLR